MQGTEGDLPSSSEVQKAKQQRSKNAIPIIASIPADTDLLDASSLCSTDLDGIALTSAQLPSVAQSFASSTASSADAQVQAILSAILSSPQERKTPDQETSHSDNGHKKQGKQLLSAAKEDLVEAERQLLEQLLGLLQQATPEMQEMSMLTDALKQLDELFLLVVVGEFNSGKSSVINALLGSRYATANNSHSHSMTQNQSLPVRPELATLQTKACKALPCFMLPSSCLTPSICNSP